MKKGDLFTTPDGARIEVTRVSREWADIRVAYGQSQWTKRQPLVNGEFAFEAARA